MPVVGYPKVIPYAKFEHFGINRLSETANDKQTDGFQCPTHADRLGYRNNIHTMA